MAETASLQQLVRPTRAVLSDGTYQAIRTMLLNHTIAPGEHISIDGMARMLDVSQTPVREALARLESDDLVLKQPLRGYAATQLLTAQEMDDLYQFRLLIEPWAAGQAANRLTDKGRSSLTHELQRGAEAAAMGDIEAAFAAMNEHDARLHEVIASASGSTFVRDAYVRTHCHLHGYRLFQANKADHLTDLYYSPTSGFVALREHEAIGDAILSGNGTLAHDRMKDHIESSQNRLHASMK